MKQNIYHYPIAIERGDEQHAYGVNFPDIPGCFSAGDTLNEALANAREALELHLEGLAEDGHQPPKPSAVERHEGKPEYKGYVWALVSIDPTPYLGKSKKINVTMPSFLITRVDECVKSHPEYRDRSKFLQIAARRLIDDSGECQA